MVTNQRIETHNGRRTGYEAIAWALPNLFAQGVLLRVIAQVVALLCLPRSLWATR